MALLLRIGPTLGGLLVDVVGWRALFCIVVAFSVLIILFAARALKNREGFPRTSADAPSIIFSSIGLAALLYGLSSFASSDHVEVCVALMVTGLIFVGLFVWRQFKIDEPMLRLEVLYSRRYRMAFYRVCFASGNSYWFERNNASVYPERVGLFGNYQRFGYVARCSAWGACRFSWR